MRINTYNMTTHNINVEGISWKEACRFVTPNDSLLSPGFSKVPQDWKKTVATMGLTDDVLFNAVYPMKGSDRYCRTMDGKGRYFIEGSNNFDKWQVLIEENLLVGYWETGDANITIKRDGDMFDVHGSFTIDDDGELYEGFYYQTFMEALDKIEPGKPDADVIEQIKKILDARNERFTDILAPIFTESNILDLDGFQEWEEGSIDPEIFIRLIRDFPFIEDDVKLTTEVREITVDGLTINALVLVPTPGWDDEFTAELEILNKTYIWDDFDDLVNLDSKYCGVCRVA